MTALASRLAAGVALLPVPMIGGCGSGGGNKQVEESSPVFSRSVTTANGLRITFAEDTDSISFGQSVDYTLTATNTTSAPITYYTRFDCSPQLLPEVDSAVTITNLASKESVVVGQPEVTCASIGAIVPKTLAPGASISGAINSSPSNGAQALTAAGTYTASVTIAAIFVGGDQTATPISLDGLPVTVAK